MNKRTLLAAMGVAEAAAGLALMAAPSILASLLLGSSLDTPAGMTIGRVAGAGMVSLGAACWLARNDESSRSATGLIGAMLFYNIAAATVLVFASIGDGLFGIGLWPVVLVHTVLAIGCIAGLGSTAVPGPVRDGGPSQKG
jgi:hypothetical protein